MMNTAASMSVCLPIEVERIIVRNVHKSMSIKDVRDAFNMTHLAEIVSADLLPLSAGGGHCDAILVVKNWKDNKNAKKFQVNLRENEKEGRLIYDAPWFWVIKEDVEFYKNDFKLEFDFKKIEMSHSHYATI